MADTGVESVVLDGKWWSSWSGWPARLVPVDVLDAAASWCVESLVCRCSRERVMALPAGERRGLLGVFIGRLNDGLGRSVLLVTGQRAVLMTRVCVGERCGHARLVRVVFDWRA